MNTCSFGSLASDMFDAIEYVIEQAIVLQLKSSLLFESKWYKVRIKFANYIMIGNEINKGKQSRYYNLLQWKDGGGRII